MVSTLGDSDRTRTINIKIWTLKGKVVLHSKFADVWAHEKCDVWSVDKIEVGFAKNIKLVFSETSVESILCLWPVGMLHT